MYESLTEHEPALCPIFIVIASVVLFLKKCLGSIVIYVHLNVLMYLLTLLLCAVYEL